MVIFTAREMSGGNGHEHIVRLWWEDTNSTANPNSGHMDIDTATQWLDNRENRAFVEDRNRPRNFVEAFVVKPSRGRWYIRTAANGQWTDNLLGLPERRAKAA